MAYPEQCFAMGTTTKPKPSPLTIADLREALAPEPLMQAKIGIRVTKAEYDRLQRLAAAAGVTTAHACRRVLAIAAEALLSADQEG